MFLPNISLILPCYNEENFVRSRLPQFLAELTHFELLSQVELIVVDDGSTDQSWPLLQKYSPAIRLLRHEKNLGYGAALKLGFGSARGELIGFMDMDDTCKIKDLVALKNTLLEKNSDIVWGNRLAHNSQMPFVRRIGNLFYSSLINLFFKAKLKDSCSGYRLFRRQHLPLFLEKMPDDLNFSLMMTLKTISRKLNFCEIEIAYDQRIGSSKLSSLKHGLIFLFTILKYRVSFT